MRYRITVVFKWEGEQTALNFKSSFTYDIFFNWLAKIYRKNFVPLRLFSGERRRVEGSALLLTWNQNNGIVGTRLLDKPN